MAEQQVPVPVEAMAVELVDAPAAAKVKKARAPHKPKAAAADGELKKKQPRKSKAKKAVDGDIDTEAEALLSCAGDGSEKPKKQRKKKAVAVADADAPKKKRKRAVTDDGEEAAAGEGKTKKRARGPKKDSPAKRAALRGNRGIVAWRVAVAQSGLLVPGAKFAKIPKKNTPEYDRIIARRAELLAEWDQVAPDHIPEQFLPSNEPRKPKPKRAKVVTPAEDEMLVVVDAVPATVAPMVEVMA